MLRPKVVTTVIPGVQRCLAKHAFPAKLVDVVRWDVLHASMELYYSDAVDVGMFSRLLDLYVADFLPCGWEGEPADGVLRVW